MHIHACHITQNQSRKGINEPMGKRKSHKDSLGGLGDTKVVSPQDQHKMIVWTSPIIKFDWTFLGQPAKIMEKCLLSQDVEENHRLLIHREHNQTAETHGKNENFE